MGLIQGITVTLYERVQAGVDEMYCPIYTETPVNVDNVLVSPSSVHDIAEGNALEEKKTVFWMAIPKGDMHTWEDCRVDFLGKSWKVVGHPEEGIESMIPLDWHKKYMVERYG